MYFAFALLSISTVLQKYTLKFVHWLWIFPPYRDFEGKKEGAESRPFRFQISFLALYSLYISSTASLALATGTFPLGKQ